MLKSSIEVVGVHGQLTHVTGKEGKETKYLRKCLYETNCYWLNHTGDTSLMLEIASKWRNL